MRGRLMLYRDQWNNTWFASTVKELCEKVGYSKARPMFISKKTGDVQIGYVVGPHWLQAFQPWEK